MFNSSFSWIYKISPKFSAGARPRRNPTARRCQLRCEELEDRQLLALVINPTFGASILNDPNAATIEKTINTAIAAYESCISTPITVNITFQEMATGLGHNQTNYNTVSYASYRAALASHATSADDATALANLPTSGGAVDLETANLRALGLPGGNVGMDSVISLNTSICNLDRTSVQDPTKYDLLEVTCHEMMEVFGHGSDLDYPLTGAVAPTDLYRFDLTTGQRSFNTASTTQSYFSIDGGKTNLVQFNQNSTGDYGDWVSPTPMIQNAFGTRGATPNLGLELRELDVLGYTRIANFTPVVTAATTQNNNPGVATSFSLGSFVDPDTGPWKVTVSWGDGTADTSFFVASAGSLGSKVHTYAPGNYVAKISVTDFTGLTGTSSFNIGAATTSVSLDGSKNLLIQDVASGGKNDNLTLKSDNTNSRFIISDPSPASTFALTGSVPGATLSADHHTVYVPFAAVTGRADQCEHLRRQRCTDQGHLLKRLQQDHQL